ncbi:MAG: UvrD-helicase domain-containing protein [Spirochaetales bacterium]|nr:UvrD-helicase domain-containing protein [Spirochaetales bacterium]
MKPESAEILKSLNPRQREAVEHQGGPLLILAGAGSGKTRVITTKIAWLVSEGIYTPREILAVTFTNKAAGEMSERVRRMTPEGSGVLIRTFHSFGAWLLRRYAATAGLDKNFVIYDDDDSVTLLKSIYEKRTRKELGRYAHLISRAKDYCLKPSDDLKKISLDPELPEIYKRYQKRLDEMGNADFGDLIMKAVALLGDHGDIKQTVQDRFKVILVDEFQDSNQAQFELLRILKGKDTYLCVVGDDDQSIYRFRGAEVRNILEFHRRFSGTDIVRLEQNYRSTQSILELASRVVSSNRSRLGKKLWTSRKGGEKPALVYLGDQDEEAEYCSALLADGRLEETAILYRTNAQSRTFESLFTKLGIQYRIVGALRFYEREEIKDALAVLSLYLNPRDEVAFRRIINKPPRGLGDVSIEKIVAFAGPVNGDLVAAAASAARAGGDKGGLSGKAAKAAAGFAAIFAGGETGEETPLPDLITSLITASGLLAYHREQDLITGSSKLRNLEELVSASADFGAGPEGLASFLELIELDRSRFADQAEDGSERVTLITMHNTKGLEFPRVIITGLDEGIFPSWLSEGDEDLEEERRIFYVSITRAMDELYLTSCRTRRLWGRTQSFSPSRFLSEIPGGLLKIETGVADHEESPEGLSAGQQVYHDDYGSGTIIKSWYNGADRVVQVRFDTGRTARFIPKYTPLEKTSRDDR